MEDYSKKMEMRYPGSIMERFRMHCRSAPNAPCLVTLRSSLTYEAVDDQSSTIQKLLHERGTKNSSHVVIIGARIPLLTVVLLGVMKAGASFTIIDPRYPQARIQQQIQYIAAQIVVHLQDVPLRFNYETMGLASTIEILRTDIESAFLNTTVNNKFDQPAVLAKSDDLLYINFTSGTTGVPKAIWGTHCPVTHFLQWQQSTFNVVPTDKVSVLSGLSHDPILRDLFLPLWAGAASHFPPEEVYQYPGRLLSWIRDSAITVIHLTPSLARFATIVSESPRKQIPTLRLAFFGGEPLEHIVTEPFRAHFPNCKMVNCYGATETPQVMAYHPIGTDELTSSNSRIPIGRGIDGVQILILREDNQIAGPTQKGEICIRTAYRAKRVEDINKQTSIQFQTNPLNINDNEDIIYRSGDIGELDDNGNVFVIGRTDKQIKIRGFRVDISEIEKQLTKISGVTIAEVLHKNIAGTQHLAIAYLSKASDSVTPDSIREALSDSLPEFMIPRIIQRVESIPLTPNGKLDRIALEEKLFGNHSALQHNLKQEKTPIEEVIHTLQQITGNQNIVPSTPLKSLDLDSLRAVEVCCGLQTLLGKTFSIGDIFSCKVVSDLLEPTSARILLPPTPIRARPSLCASAPVTSGASQREIQSKDAFFSRNESLFRGTLNRVLQLIARVAPDRLRVWLHRTRGVSISSNVSIGYDAIIETAYPHLVDIGEFVNIGMRVTIIAHFRGMTQLHSRASVILGNDSFIGPGSIILPNVSIGAGAVVTSGSVVTTNVEPMTMVQGNPARPIARCGIPLSRDYTYEQFLAALKPIKS
jgi:amino acid adenylation domain-containing protein